MINRLKSLISNIWTSERFLIISGIIIENVIINQTEKSMQYQVKKKIILNNTCAYR